MAHADSTRSAMDHFALSASLKNISASINHIKTVYAGKASRSEQYIVVQEVGRLRDLLASRLTDFSRRAQLVACSILQAQQALGMLR